MVAVKEMRVRRLLIGFSVDPELSVREDWARSMFNALQDEFPQLLGTPIILPDQAASFLTPAGEDSPAVQICHIARRNILVGSDDPSRDRMESIPSLARRVYEVSREMFHVGRVTRLGRVQVTSWLLNTEADDAAGVIRTGLTKLGADEAADVDLLFVKREESFNINLKLSTGSNSPQPTGQQLLDLLIAQSDVNNWDVTGDVSWEDAQKIISRGAKHANEEVPTFFRERLGLKLTESH